MAVIKTLTLDPVGEKTTVALPVWEVEDSIAAAFRINWLNGSNDTTSIRLACGAGCGTPWGIFTYEKDGEKVDLIFDARELVTLLEDVAKAKLETR